MLYFLLSRWAVVDMKVEVHCILYLVVEVHTIRVIKVEVRGILFAFFPAVFYIYSDSSARETGETLNNCLDLL